MPNTKDKKSFASSMAINRTDKEGDGLDAMFPASAPQEPQQTAPKQTRSGLYRGQRTDTNDNRVAVTFKLPADMVDKLRAMAYWSRREQWQIVAEGVANCISDYETDNGPIEPIPTK